MTDIRILTPKKIMEDCRESAILHYIKIDERFSEGSGEQVAILAHAASVENGLTTLAQEIRLGLESIALAIRETTGQG